MQPQPVEIFDCLSFLLTAIKERSLQVLVDILSASHLYWPTRTKYLSEFTNAVQRLVKNRAF
jgi:hypothetical protein